MPARVHASAQVHPGAELADGVVVEPFVTVAEGVTVGADTVLRAGTVLMEGVTVGARCTLGPYAVLGGLPMDRRFRGEPSGVVVEDEVDLREFVTVHRATGEGERTRVGSGSLAMAYVHVTHNVDVGRRCVLTNGVQLGGHAQVGDDAVIGAGSLVHQFCRIGRAAMFGAGSGTNRDLLPFAMARGNPARHFRVNRVGLQRLGVEGERYRALERALRALRRRDRAAFEALAAEHDDVAHMRAFVEASRRGVAGFVTSG